MRIAAQEWRRTEPLKTKKFRQDLWTNEKVTDIKNNSKKNPQTITIEC